MSSPFDITTTWGEVPINDGETTPRASTSHVPASSMTMDEFMEFVITKMRVMETRLDHVIDQTALIRTELDDHAILSTDRAREFRQHIDGAARQVGLLQESLNGVAGAHRFDPQNGTALGRNPLSSPTTVPPIPPRPPTQPIPPIPPIAPPTPGGGSRIKFAKPEKWSGKKEDLDDFETSAATYLHMEGRGLTNQEKVMWIVGFIEGTPKKYIMTFLKKEAANNGSVAWLADPDTLLDELRRRYGDTNKKEKYRLKYNALKQTSSVQDYVRDMEEYSLELNYNDDNIRDHFYDGLKKEITDMMMYQGFEKDTKTKDEVFQEAERIDRYLANHKRTNPTPTPNTTERIKTASTVPAPTGGAGPRIRLNVNDPVFRIMNGRAQKGKIESIGRVNGALIPSIKWNNTSQIEQVPFNTLRKDERPLPPTPVTTIPAPPKKIDPKGPGPMDLDGRGIGKIQCHICKGYGHFARVCPSKPLSGNEAHIDSDSDDEEEESGKDESEAN